MRARISIKAVPLTLLALAIMEIFENTHTFAVLMRYVGAEKKEERQPAVEQMIGLLPEVRDAFNPTRGGKDLTD